MALPPGVEAIITSNYGIFGNLVSVFPSFPISLTDLVINVTNGTQIEMIVGTDGANTNIEWDAIAALYNADPSVNGFSSMEGNPGDTVIPGGSGSLVGASSGLAAGQFYFGAPEPPPPPSLRRIPAGGGRIRLVNTFINAFDVCLSRDYALYDCIDPQAFACGRKPLCFCQDEREWGGSWGDAEEISMGPPKGAIAFNPTGSVPLPDTADGDVTIFQFVVPKGYDGIILGQYHQYSPKPLGGIVTPFVEGSGDIVWRVSAARRFVRDCGEMTVSLGTARALSPVAGGIQLRANNLVKYIVNVPNLSGTLAPGLGSINAGLHGYFWPRR